MNVGIASKLLLIYSVRQEHRGKVAAVFCHRGSFKLLVQIRGQYLDNCRSESHEICKAYCSDGYQRVTPNDSLTFPQTALMLRYQLYIQHIALQNQPHRHLQTCLVIIKIANRQ